MAMNLKHIVFLILLNILSAPLFGQNSAMREYRFDVGDFNKLNVNNSISVVYRCNPDSAGIVKFKTSDEVVASDILFSNNGKGSVSVSLDFDFVAGTPLPVINIYSSGLDKITNSGDSLVIVENLAPREKFSAVLIGNGRLDVKDVSMAKIDASIRSGNGTINIDGNCREGKLNIVGTGTISAERLKCTNCKASIVGTGNINCDVVETLNIQGMGSGRVQYVSQPEQIRSRAAGIKHGRK